MTDRPRLSGRDAAKEPHVDVLFILPPLFVFMGRDSSTFPLGLGYLVAFLKKKGISARIYNADVQQPVSHGEGPLRTAARSVLRAISGFSYFAKRWSSYYDRVDDLGSPIWANLRTVLRATQPKIVGISASVITVPSAAVVARIVREELPEAKVVVGGPAATTCAEQMKNDEAIDYLVSGEGERTVAELAAFILGRGKAPARREDIRGLVYREGAKVVTTERRPLMADLDSLPFPDREAMFALGEGGEIRTLYANADILASRGCPYPCRFCCAFAIWGTRRTRFRSTENIVAELVHLNTKYGQRFFVFWDDLFTANRARTVELCSRIIGSGLDIEWVCLVRLSTVDAELLALMKRAGCREIQIGVESGNDRILHDIGKDLTLATIRAKVPIIRASGINWGVFLIIGFPSETRAEMEDSLRLIEEIRPTWVSLNIFSPYPGADLFDELKAQGRLGEESMRGEFWYPHNNYTGTMQDEEFTRFAIRALRYADRYNVRQMFRPASVLKKLRRLTRAVLH
jgi:radical SAM superfamily enzyme YgiQ (UPF0313 family)